MTIGIGGLDAFTTKIVPILTNLPLCHPSGMKIVSILTKCSPGLGLIKQFG
ncbi:MAG: hypothetical protein K6T83_23585 [Alicyclobacillus sp.]|nr:hypothetical protein [Alicyclobacillus sp.]